MIVVRFWFRPALAGIIIPVASSSANLSLARRCHHA